MSLLFLIIISAAFFLEPTAHGFAPTQTISRHGVALHRHCSLFSSSSLEMFTGIIEEMGEVLSLATKSDMTLWDGSQGIGTEMVIKGNIVLDGAYLGCSISVNGVCLTATELNFEERTFKVGLAPETLRRTNLGNYDAATASNNNNNNNNNNNKSKHMIVNLERASEIGGRNSGHFVQGHVDGVGTIIDRWVDGNSLFFKVSFPYEYMRYIVPKGFIAIDGTSLTVCDVKTSERGDGAAEDNWFTFMLVEYTQKKIIIPMKEVGDTVNIEVDVLGKYSERVWEIFMPKMEALELKVNDLERKILELERITESNDEVSPKKFSEGTNSDERRIQSTSYSEKWIREGQEFFHATDMNPKRENRNTAGTDWVRTKQEFYDTNY